MSVLDTDTNNAILALAYQPAGSFPGFLHLAVGSFPQSLQELVPVLQIVFVVVPLHGLLPGGHLSRSSPERSVSIG